MTLVCWLLERFAGVTSISTIGDLYTLPSGLPEWRLPSIPEGETIFSTMQSLLPVAFTIAMLGAIESLLSAMVADGVIGDKHNSNTELIGQGIANIVVPFFGGIPATGAIARTMANINNGGRTPIAGIVHTVVLLLVLLFLGGLVGAIPMPCLAGVLIMVSYNMSGWRTIRSMCRQSRSDIAILFTTMLLTIIFDLTIAIEVGLGLAVVLFVRRIMETSKISILRDEMDVHHDGEDGEVHIPRVPPHRQHRVVAQLGDEAQTMGDLFGAVQRLAAFRAVGQAVLPRLRHAGHFHEGGQVTQHVRAVGGDPALDGRAHHTSPFSRSRRRLRKYKHRSTPTMVKLST